jgi:hypothetical protein
MVYTAEKVRNIIQGILPLYRIDDDGRWRPFYLVKLYQDFQNPEMKDVFKKTFYEIETTAKYEIENTGRRDNLMEVCYIIVYKLGFDLSRGASEFIKKEKEFEEKGFYTQLQCFERTLSGVEKDHEYYLRHLRAALRSAEYHKVHPDTIEFLNELKSRVEKKMAEE